MLYKECSRCILNTKQDPDINFDESGLCNHCRAYEEKANKLPKTNEEKALALENFITTLKAKKGKSKYDCVLGLSGGVDSSFLCLRMKEIGLNPLVVHFDNGWNSELAVNNIQNIIEKLEFDLYTYVVDWEEFRELQKAYIKAGVLDWEIPTDHGFYATMHKQALRHKINSVVSGHNHVTEGILPKCMRWDKIDVLNIKDINSKYGTKNLRTFPLFNIVNQFYIYKIRKINRYTPLNFMDYHKSDAKKEITEKLGWRDYGGKHYESIFTRFYQGYALVAKFGFDKRYAHLSTLINSGQITKEDALNEIKKPAYEQSMFEADKEYVIKKLGFTVEEFDDIMKAKPVSHTRFKTVQKDFWEPYFKMARKLKPIKQIFG